MAVASTAKDSKSYYSKQQLVVIISAYIIASMLIVSKVIFHGNMASSHREI